MIPATKRTKDELREITRKGGIASGKARRKKKQIQQIAQAWMALPILGADRNRLLELGFKEEDLNNQWPIVMMGLQKKMAQGDVKAIEKMQELVDQQTNQLIKLKERELAIRERELSIKEELLKQEQKEENSGVTLIYDINERD